MVAITTVDNPYDPFEQFVPWNLYDVQHHYNSCELLADHAFTSEQMTDNEYAEEIERAIDEIIDSDVLGIYMKVKASGTKE